MAIKIPPSSLVVLSMDPTDKPLLDLVSTAAKSGGLGDPIVYGWDTATEAFYPLSKQADTSKLPSAKTFPAAMSAIREHVGSAEKPVAFFVGIDATKTLAALRETLRITGRDDGDLVGSLEATAGQVAETPSHKRLVLVTKNGDARFLLGNLKFEPVSVSPTTTRKPHAAPAGAVPSLADSIRGDPREDQETDTDWQFDHPLQAQNIERESIENLFKWREPCRRRLRSALDEVQQRFVGRKHALEMMVACALTGTNLVFLGPPGTAKSLMVRSFAELLGIRPVVKPIADEREFADAVDRINSGKGGVRDRRRLFEYLVTRYTTPEELFGAANIEKLLKAGIHFRSTEGMLPRAEVVFLDEIFKANSAILNALLSVLNERLFYNMGQAFKVEVVFAVGASNEPPDLEELGALYDRFPIRVLCQPVHDHHLTQLLESAHRFRRADSGRLAHRASINDIRVLSKVIRHRMFGGDDAPFPTDATDDFRNGFMELLRMTRHEFGVSDRTADALPVLCRALALLEDTYTLDKRHLRPFGYLAPNAEALLDLQRIVARKIGGSPETLFDGF